MLKQDYDSAVIGGGVYGLSTAFHLAQRGLRVLICEQFTLGHEYGSSHGPSRITRSTYDKDLFHDLNELALKQDWPKMEEILQTKIIYKNQYIAFADSPEHYSKLQKVALKHSNNIILTPEQVCERYPQMPLIKISQKAIVDTNAGIVRSDAYMLKLIEWLRHNSNVVIYENTAVKKIQQTEDIVKIQMEDGSVNAKKVVLACGRWIKQLVPEMGSLLKVIKQVVGYLNMENKQIYEIGKFPSFLILNEEGCFCVVPDCLDLGVKVYNHKTNTSKDYPDLTLPEETEILRKFAIQIFGDKFKGVSDVNQCYYTVSKNEDFVLDWINPRVLICSCCSGHGFKFSSLMGRITSDVLIENKSIELYQQNRNAFTIQHHRKMKHE